VGFHPLPQPPAQAVQPEEQVPCGPQFQRGASRDARARVDEVGGLQHGRAVLALVAAGGRVAAPGAGAHHIPVREEPAVRRRVELLDLPLRDKPVFVEPAEEVLGQRVVLRPGGAAEEVEAEAELPVHLGLAPVLDVAAGSHVHPGLGRRDLGRRAVLVRGADEQDLLALRPEEAGEDVGGKQGARQVPQVLHPVDVGEGAGNQVTAHAGPTSRCCTTRSYPPAALPRRRKSPRPRKGTRRAPRGTTLFRPARRAFRGYGPVADILAL